MADYTDFSIFSSNENKVTIKSVIGNDFIVRATYAQNSRSFFYKVIPLVEIEGDIYEFHNAYIFEEYKEIDFTEAFNKLDYICVSSELTFDSTDGGVKLVWDSGDASMHVSTTEHTITIQIVDVDGAKTSFVVPLKTKMSKVLGINYSIDIFKNGIHSYGALSYFKKNCIEEEL